MTLTLNEIKSAFVWSIFTLGASEFALILRHNFIFLPVALLLGVLYAVYVFKLVAGTSKWLKAGKMILFFSILLSIEKALFAVRVILAYDKSFLARDILIVLAFLLAYFSTTAIFNNSREAS